MRFFFHEAAEAELDEAVDYYEGCRSGLGLEFAEEVFATIQRITEFPRSGLALSANTRRCLVNRFPFAVVYQVARHQVRIVAIAAHQRRPGYWRDRE